MSQENKNYLPTVAALVGVSLIGLYVAYKQDTRVGMNENSLDYKIYKSRKESKRKTIDTVNNATKERDLLNWMNKIGN